MTEEATQDEKPIRSGESSQPGDSIEAGETPARKKSRLASALAAGMRVEDWACENSVARSTAYRWAALPEVKAEIREWRRRAIHETIGQAVEKAPRRPVHLPRSSGVPSDNNHAEREVRPAVIIRKNSYGNRGTASCRPISAP